MDIIIQIAVVLFALSIHESAHGWMADRFGDPTARHQGRITLNPVAHIDPVGTVIFPAILAITGAPVFGWAKPVPFNPYNLRNPLKDEIYIAAAGPMSNIIAGTIGIVIFVLLKSVKIIGPLELRRLILHLNGVQGANPNPLTLILFFLVLINFFLAIFNLIPVPPLDGSKVLKGFLKGEALRIYRQIEPYGFLILILIIITPVLDIIARPILSIIFRILF